MRCCVVRFLSSWRKLLGCEAEEDDEAAEEEEAAALLLLSFCCRLSRASSSSAISSGFSSMRVGLRESMRLTHDRTNSELGR